jgi:hypothetical protein
MRGIAETRVFVNQLSAMSRAVGRDRSGLRRGAWVKRHQFEFEGVLGEEFYGL